MGRNRAGIPAQPGTSCFTTAPHNQGSPGRDWEPEGNACSYTKGRGRWKQAKMELWRGQKSPHGKGGGKNQRPYLKSSGKRASSRKNTQRQKHRECWDVDWEVVATGRVQEGGSRTCKGRPMWV